MSFGTRTRNRNRSNRLSESSDKEMQLYVTMTILERKQRLQVRRRFITTLQKSTTLSSMILLKHQKKPQQSLVVHRRRSTTADGTTTTTTSCANNVSMFTSATSNEISPPKQQPRQHPSSISKLLWKMKRSYQKRRAASGGSINNPQQQHHHSILSTKLYIDRTTYAVMKLEIQQLISFDQTRNVMTSPLSMVNALLGSRYLFNVYAEETMGSTTSSFLSHGNRNNKFTPLVRRFGSIDIDTENLQSRRGSYLWTADSSTQRRYDLINTLNKLQQHVSSMAKEEDCITSWEDAMVILSKVLYLPTDDDDDDEKSVMSSSAFIVKATDDTTLLSTTNETNTASSTNDSTTDARTEMFLQRLRDIRIEEMSPPGLRPSQHKWLEIANAALLSNASSHQDDVPKEENHVKEAAPLFRDLTDEEQDLVDRAMHGGHDTDIVARTKDDTDSVQRSNLRTLLPCEWVNDEVIHYYLCLLQQRDEQLCCSSNNNRKRTHFFKSFFMTKLLDEGNINPALDGVYNYNNVKRWSKKVPGKDIFNLSKIVFPINQGNQHWTSAIIYMEEQRIQYYDSLGGSGKMYLQVLLQYIQDEHLDKKKTPMKSPELWKLVPCTNDTPRQQNGYDCGVFTCMFADFLSIDRSFDGFHPRDMSLYRQHIALSIVKGEVTS